MMYKSCMDIHLVTGFSLSMDVIRIFISLDVVTYPLYLTPFNLFWRLPIYK